MAVTMKAAKGLNLNWSAIIILIRLANLFTYVALMYLAIRVLPEGHALMCLIALFPQNLFLASTCSYDAFVTAAMCAGTAFCVRILRSDSLNIKDAVFMCLFMLLSCLVKAVYAPVMLIGLAVPKKIFRSSRERAYYCCFLAAVCLITVLFFIMPTVLAPSAGGDTRGSSDVSEMTQIGFILSNPFKYAWILLSQMVRWIPQCLIGPDCTTFMGHIVNGSTAFKGYYIPYFAILLILLLAGIAEKLLLKTDNGISPVQRLWALFMCFGASVLTWTSMYVAFTSPGKGEIDGVQGRYFIPLFFLIYFFLGADHVKKAGVTDAGTGVAVAGAANGGIAAGTNALLDRIRPIWYYIMSEILALLTALSVFTSVIGRFSI